MGEQVGGEKASILFGTSDDVLHDGLFEWFTLNHGAQRVTQRFAGGRDRRSILEGQNISCAEKH